MSAHGNTLGLATWRERIRKPAADTLREAGRKPVLSWRAVAEAAAMLALLAGTDAAIGGHAMLGLQPHPFGAVVLLIAAQYGIAEASVTALMASLLLFGLNPVSQQFGQDRVAWLGQLALSPLLWFAAALVIGAISNRLRSRNAELAVTASAARAELATMVDTNTRLARNLSTLEGRVAGQLNTVSAIYEAARGLGTDVTTVLQGAPVLVRAATQCTKCSVYLLEGAALRLAVSDGWGHGDAYDVTIERTALFDAVVGDRATLLANRPADRRVLGDAGLLAASIVDPVTGAVLGMVKVEAIAFADLNLDTVANFRAVAAWLAQALSQASQMAEAQAERFLIDPRIISARHADTIVAQMTRVAARIGYNLSLLQIALPPLEDGGRYRAVMLDAMRTVFRASDILLEADQDHRHFSVLLPGIPSQGVREASDRLFLAVHERDPALFGIMSVSCVLLHQIGGGDAG